MGKRGVGDRRQHAEVAHVEGLDAFQVRERGVIDLFETAAADVEVANAGQVHKRLVSDLPAVTHVEGLDAFQVLTRSISDHAAADVEVANAGQMHKHAVIDILATADVQGGDAGQLRNHGVGLWRMHPHDPRQIKGIHTTPGEIDGYVRISQTTDSRYSAGAGVGKTLPPKLN